MNKMKCIITVVIIVLTINIQSQTYSFSVSTGSYTNLTGSKSLNNGLTWDDPQFEIPVGFNFHFFSTSTNKLFIEDFGLGGLLTTDTSEMGVIPMLIPYFVDIIDRGYDFNIGDNSIGSLSNISYLLEGVLGSQILKIEWRNVGFYSELEDDDVSSDFTNFQLWLYEGTNDIEVHFGPNSITQPNLSFDGETGSTVALLSDYDIDNDSLINEAYVLEGNVVSPTIKALTSVDFFTFLNGVIPNGTIYKFSNTTTGISEFKSSVNFSIYPNPATNNIIISQQSGNYDIETINIYDANGKLFKILEKIDKHIDISNFVNGLYFLQIKTDKGFSSKVLIKE